MIYLDHNATSPVLPHVRKAMEPYLTEYWGNAASSYRFGSKLKTVVEEARSQVASLLKASSQEIIFTSGGSEANNTAINGSIAAAPLKRHIVTCKTEHSSVLAHFNLLETQGYRVTYLQVDTEGLVSTDELSEAIRQDTALVSIMWVNNETGVIGPIRKLAGICAEKGVPFHCDAVQAAGRLDLNLKEIPVTYLSLSGHKFGSPKGVGALYVKKTATFKPYVFGGHQNRGRRGGTEPVFLLVALGMAAEMAQKGLLKYQSEIAPLRDKIESELLAISGSELNGHVLQRIANTTNISFKGVLSEPLLLLLDQAGICASSGSACLAESSDPSHVIAAMKPVTEASKSALRISIGREINAQEIAKVTKEVVRCVSILRGI